jgi:hypothetical protein
MSHINPKIRAHVIHVGQEQTPVCIIDDFLLDSSAAINAANKRTFKQQYNSNGTHYPGVRAPVGEEYDMALLDALLPVLYKVYKVPNNLTLYPRGGAYSLLTQTEESLQPLQCLPHYDNASTFSFAMLHYLNPGKFGGTGFYRHKPSGFENISSDRRATYLHSVQDFIARHGQPKQQYFTRSDEHFDLLETIEYEANRLVIYPATLLHSAFIEQADRDVNADPETGRLSANFFIEFK